MPGQNQPVKMSRQHAARLAQFAAMAEEQIVRLGAAIQRRREELKWSRSRLAREIPVDVKTIERWEKAQSGGAMDALSKIAQALDTTADDLLAASLERNGRQPKAGDLDELSPSKDSVDALRQDLEALRFELLAELAAVREVQEAVLRRLPPEGYEWGETGT